MSKRAVSTMTGTQRAFTFDSTRRPEAEKPKLSRRARLLKGLFERIVATTVLVVAAPLMLAAAIAIKLDSRGPVLFKQTRVGLNGKPFQLVKFRSMVSDADIVTVHLAPLNDADPNGFLFKIRQDPRVTRVGRWLR